MEFKRWLEAKWHEFGDSVTLYHGTSSALVDRMQKEGIKPPKKDFVGYAMEVVEHYLGRVPEDIKQQIFSTISTRKDTASSKVENVIYLASEYREAESYAGYTFRFGGEIHAEMWRICNNWMARQKDPQNPDYNSVHVKPRYDDSRPVVLEVEVPYSWMLTYNDLRKTFQGYLDLWKRNEKTYKQQFRTFEDFLDEQGFEVRIAETIPPSMIKKAHSVTGINAPASTYARQDSNDQP